MEPLQSGASWEVLISSGAPERLAGASCFLRPSSFLLLLDRVSCLLMHTATTALCHDGSEPRIDIPSRPTFAYKQPKAQSSLEHLPGRSWWTALFPVLFPFRVDALPTPFTILCLSIKLCFLHSNCMDWLTDFAVIISSISSTSFCSYCELLDQQCF